MEITIYKKVQGTKYPQFSNIGERIKVDSLIELNSIIIESAHSPGIFRGDERKNENFLYADTIELDFDGGIAPTQVHKKLKSLGLDHSITLTRHHLKNKKSGKREMPPDHRFRVIIPLEKRVTTVEQYTHAWNYLASLFPEIDQQCKDPARFFFASVNGVWEGSNGRS